MESFLAFDGLAATAGHIDLIQSKLEKLQDARDDSWAQLLTMVARKYRAEEINSTQLQQFYRDMRESYGPGWTRVWNAHMPVTGNRLAHVAARDRRIAEQRKTPSWSGVFPINDQEAPLAGISVVYVLFDKAGVPAYIGSTATFRERMKAHRSIRPKLFVRWIAYRCDDREAAYELEVRLLRENLPYLNRKVGR